MRFKQHAPRLLSLPEMEEELKYLQKRMYRLEKLKRLGLNVEPDLQVVAEREAILDVGVRERLIAMEEIPN